MIEIQDIYKKINKKSILKGINLIIDKGEKLAVIGKSGCGKSMLLKHILGIISPDKGHILIDNININRASGNKLNNLRKKCAMVFQGGALFDSLTVAENVSFFLDQHTNLNKEEKIKRVKEKLDQVNLKNILDKKPAELSGGMRKRVAIARAIIMEPEILLYDEPTTGLDPPTAEDINLLIKKINKEFNVTSVIVTHDIISALKLADKIVMMDEGQIIAHGTPDEIKKNQHPLIQRFLQNQ